MYACYSAVVLVWVWVVGTGSGLSWREGDGAVFNWHPVLMSTAIVCASQSVILFKSGRFSRETRKRGHAFLHVSAAVLMLCGLIAVFRFHNEHKPPIKNLYSLHSWLGITTMFVYSVQALGGAVTFLTGVFTAARKRRFLPFHAGFGLVIVVLMMSGKLECRVRVVTKRHWDEFNWEYVYVVTALTGISERLIFLKACNPSCTAQCLAGHSLGFVIVGLCCVVFAVLR